MTRWRWITLAEDLTLTLTLDSDDPEQIARVEKSAEANGITLTRIEEQPEGATGRLPEDYWETAE